MPANETSVATLLTSGTRLQTAAGLIPEVPGGYRVKDKDGTLLAIADLNKFQFRQYLAQVFNPTFAGRCTKEIFNTPANTTILAGLNAIITFISTPANLPTRVGTGVESGVDTKSGVIWHVLNAIKAARGLKVPEETVPS
jgi:hypothetical protein